MERMNEYQGNLKHADSSSGAKPVSNTTGEAGNSSTRPRSGPREQEQFMPIANVIRIMRRILPGHAKISDEAKETVQECVSEFISFVTGEANERCQQEQRKTVTAEDLLWAMAKLGFDDYLQPLSVFLSNLRASDPAQPRPADPNISNRVGPVNMNEPYVGGFRGPVAHPHHQYQVGSGGGPYGAGLNLAEYQEFFDAISGGYARAGPTSSGASGSGSDGVGSSYSSLQNGGVGSFDPFAHFK